ncbi:hypothetical protein ACF0H5_000964 [Mactra antiquata]
MESDVSIESKMESEGYMYGETYLNSLSYSQQSTCGSLKGFIPSQSLTLTTSFNQGSGSEVKFNGGNFTGQPAVVSSFGDFADENCVVSNQKTATVLPQNMNDSYNSIEKDLSCLENSEDVMLGSAQTNNNSTNIKTDDECLNKPVGDDKDIIVQETDVGKNVLDESLGNKSANITLKIKCDSRGKESPEKTKKSAKKFHKSKRKTTKEKEEKSSKSSPSLLHLYPSKKEKSESENMENSTDQVCKSQSRRYFNSNHFSEVFAGFHEFQKLGKYCDVRLCMEDGNILAHSIILISANSYFHKLYKSLPKIYSHIEPIKSLMISDIPHWAMDKIVAYLYTGETEIEESLAGEFIKYCSDVGIFGLEWKDVAIPLSDDVDMVKDGSKSDSKVKLVKSKINGLKTGEKLKVNAEKSRKRKTSDSKHLERKPKKIKLTLSSKMKTVDDDNVTVKVEQSDDNGSNDISNYQVKEDSGIHCDNFLSDNDVRAIDNNDGIENVPDDKEDMDASGDDTDSYFEVNVEDLDDRTEKVEDNVGEKTKYLVDMNLETINCDGGPCDKCGRSFVFQYELTAHKSKCTGKNNRQRKKCVTCNMNFDSTEDYLNHRSTDKICIALRQEKLTLRKQKRFEMRRKFACCVCPRRFRRNADKIEHEFSAHEIKYDKEQWPDLFCEFCNYWTMNPWKLHQHKQVSCSKGQEQICDMCGNTYKNEKTLKKHKELMHIDIQPMLTCEECGKSLKGKKGLQHHIRLQHRKENLHNYHMCHICSQTYRTDNDLTFHLYKAHDQPLPEGYIVYRCDMCDYVHNNRRFYERHMFLHEDKREWLCVMCSKAFKTKNSLHTHMTVHTSQRLPCPFDDCTYKALKNCHLKNHIENQHTQKGEKREKCHLCDYSTFFKGNLLKHQRSVHKLEVVTRHSVEMKAKYKNLKSGQILGSENDTSICNTSTSAVPCSSREVTCDNMSTVSIPQNDLPYTATTSLNTADILDSTCTSIFQNKTISIPTQQVVEPLIYTANHSPLFTRQANYQTMNNTTPFDISSYYSSSTMPQM